MGETIQVNFRWPEGLVSNLEFVAKNLKVQKGNWARMKISQALIYEMDQLITHITRRYVQRYIDEEDYFEKMGKSPTKELTVARKKYLAKPDTVNGKKAARKFLLEPLNIELPDENNLDETNQILFSCPFCKKKNFIELQEGDYEKMVENRKIMCPECDEEINFTPCE
ncbi:MAG: hypothetical protein ACOCP4_01420 [Candidatus Woesearchaeota archaeon]